ncbi:hypothetical protein V8E36_002692 [Tilletia maclaganii]
MVKSLPLDILTLDNNPRPSLSLPCVVGRACRLQQLSHQTPCGPPLAWLLLCLSSPTSQKHPTPGRAGQPHTHGCGRRCARRPTRTGPRAAGNPASCSRRPQSCHRSKPCQSHIVTLSKPLTPARRITCIEKYVRLQCRCGQFTCSKPSANLSLPLYRYLWPPSDSRDLGPSFVRDLHLAISTLEPGLSRAEQKDSKEKNILGRRTIDESNDCIVVQWVLNQKQRLGRRARRKRGGKMEGG